MSYALVQVSPFQVIETYASDLPPDLVIWPNGDSTHGATAGFERNGCRVVEVVYGPDAPGEFYNNTATTPSLSLDGKVLTYTRTWTLRALATVKAALVERIDAAAETARAKYITPGSGQAITYQDKAGEADRCAADQNPTPEKYPLLAASVGIDGAAVSDVALAVQSNVRLWRAAAASIERSRLRGKAAVNAARDSAAAIASFNSIEWP